MQGKSIEIWVGVFVLAGLLALAMLAFKVGNLANGGSGDSYRVTAHFDNIGGLNVKAPVTMAGVRVGRVSAINVDRERYNAVVEIDIETQYDNLPKDTIASILTAGLLGSQYIGLEPGGDEKFLVDGDQLSFTQSAIILEHLIGRLLFGKASGDNQ